MKKLETKLEKVLERLLFGDCARGEKLRKPTLHTTNPDYFISYNAWCQRYNVSKMYVK